MTGAAARVEAQAKLNLFLHVLSREPSGYHQLVTLLQRIALADSVTVRTGGRARSLDCRGAETGPVEKNLAWRAAIAFTEATEWPSGFAIEIEKRIPVGGGLGGGSADAGAVLRALNALARRPLDSKAMAAIALGLGADVPYLVSEAALAYATGRGERLTPLESLPARRVVLVVPEFGVASADAFAWHAAAVQAAAKRRSGGPAENDSGVAVAETWDRVAAAAVNDLEGVVFAHHPEVGALRDSIERAGAMIARMTGSGSTLFGVFELSADDHAADVVLEVGPSARVVPTRTVEEVARVEML